MPLAARGSNLKQGTVMSKTKIKPPNAPVATQFAREVESVDRFEDDVDGEYEVLSNVSTTSLALPPVPPNSLTEKMAVKTNTKTVVNAVVSESSFESDVLRIPTPSNSTASGNIVTSSPFDDDASWELTTPSDSQLIAEPVDLVMASKKDEEQDQDDAATMRPTLGNSGFVSGLRSALKNEAEQKEAAHASLTPKKSFVLRPARLVRDTLEATEPEPEPERASRYSRIMRKVSGKAKDVFAAIPNPVPSTRRVSA